MEQYGIGQLLEPISTEIANFTIGFAKLRNRGGEEDVDPAGSGSLVTIGSIDGILTAAHVLRNLPDQGKIGLVRFTNVASVVQKQTIDMGQTEKLTIAADDFGPVGPDLGFLRLSAKDLVALKATNSFFNLEKRRESVLACHQPGPQYFDGISGMIAEWTTDLPGQRGLARIKGFRGLYGVGLVVKEHESNGFDLFDFKVTYEKGSKSPSSYKGMSGGALWRVYATMDGNGQLSVSDKRVFGIAFHQSDISDQKRIITCHGPRSVYGSLIDAIREKWSQ